MYLSIIGLISVLFVFLYFLRKLGNTIPILELLVLIAGLQWIVGPYVEYQTDFEHFKYYMYVEEQVYMRYVVPAYIFFTVTLLYYSRKYNFIFSITDDLHLYSSFGFKILILGLLVDLVQPFIPEQLNFVIYLFSNFKYVGAIILYFSKINWHRYALYVALVLLVAQSLSSAMFHTFLIWSVFFYIFRAYKNKPSQKFSVTLILVGFLLGTVIQTVKSDYRSLVWSDYSGNKISLFLDILSTKLSGGLIENNEEQEALNVRLNQGWIISTIIDHTEKNDNFARGETILEALDATLMPRFLFPEKRRAESSVNFMKYTGLYVNKNTSMGMSIIGEAYANFGKNGGIIFMVFWALFLSFIWGFIMRNIQRHNLLLFFLPLIFLQVIKAETDLLAVLNHLVKSLIFVFGFIWLWKSFVNSDLENSGSTNSILEE